MAEIASDSVAKTKQPFASRPDWAGRDFDAAERRALIPPERSTAWQWAAKYRYLTARQSLRCPGPWRDENQPILRGIMEIASRPSVREAWIKKSGQLGVSEAVRNVIGCRADQNPLSLLLVLPNEKKGREVVRTRIIPLFQDTRRLRALLTGRRLDFKLSAISLINGFDFRLAYAGSPTSLAADPIATVILDEVDKFEQPAGREADPVDLARTRLRTLEQQKRSLLIALSTPTTDDGPVAVESDRCPIKLHYYTPCPHCGAFQRLVFDRLHWEKFPDLIEANARGAAVKARHAAWFECENPRCAEDFPDGAGRILDVHKLPMLLKGYWGTPDGSWKLFFDGREEGVQPEGDKIAMHAPAMYDVAVPWSSIAAEFIAADGRPDRLQHFYNSTLAETFKLHSGPTATATIFSAKCRPDIETGFTPSPARIVPLWASRLLMTVDTQKDHFYFVIRAWGQRMRSQRIHHGRVASFAELEELFYRAHFPYPDGKYPPIRCYKVGIDSGGGTDDQTDANRTQQVYEWCNIDPIWRIPLKGSRSFEERIKWRNVLYQPPKGQRSSFTVRLYLWDGSFYRDLLASYINSVLPVLDESTGEITDDVPQWELNDLNDEAYNHQMANVIKKRIRKGRGHVDVWATRTEGARHDYHDCEAEQIMMAHGPGECYALLTPAQLATQAAAVTAPIVRGGIRMPDGRPFLPRR